jgi:hypothetical protein
VNDASSFLASSSGNVNSQAAASGNASRYVFNDTVSYCEYFYIIASTDFVSRDIIIMIFVNINDL